MPAACNKSSTVTPLQGVSNFDHLVTQWMSPRHTVCGRASNSFQLQLASGFGPSLIVNLQPSRSTRGVGPFARTGKSSVRYWPGGSRRAISSLGGRPENPRVVIVWASSISFHLRFHASVALKVVRNVRPHRFCAQKIEVDPTIRLGNGLQEELALAARRLQILIQRSETMSRLLRPEVGLNQVRGVMHRS